MADIRINALTTTATSSASDDFIAIDGAANGTRKLSVYSPTFGGNLTVSGGTTTLADSSGTFGTLTGSYNAGNQFVRLNRAGNTEYVGMFADNTIRFATNSAEAARFVSSGNLLLGTTTDNGYKLQVNGSTWTNGSARLANDLFVYGGLASPSGYITSNSGAGGLYFANQGTSTAMRFYTTDSGATAQLALTLDSSQRTILSGPLRLANAYAAGAPAATGYVTIQDSSGTTYKVLVST